MRPPTSFDELASGPVTAWVRREHRACFEGRELLPVEGPPPDGRDLEPLTGRGGTFAMRWPGLPGELVHRRLTHGGALRALTGDRFWERRPRPFVEAALSEQLRAAGVPTPRVLYAVVRRGPPGIYRGAVGTERVAGARALADALEDAARAGDPSGRALLVEAGRLVRRLHEARVRHADLNLRNLIVEAPDPADEGAPPRLQIIDLDGSRPSPRELPERARRSNLARMLRSLDKLEGARARLGPVAEEALLEGYEAAGPVLVGRS